MTRSQRPPARAPAPAPASDCVERVRAEVRRVLLQLPSRETSATPTPLIMAVSGGPDSLCMADAVLELAATLPLRPTLAHLDHGLRGEAAHVDAEFVAAFARERGCAFIVGHTDVNVLAQAERVSIEVAARRARYQFLTACAHEVGAQHIALAHNADDQAETVLLRLLRGTGLSGLRGMQVFSPLEGEGASRGDMLTLVRPLLGISRAEIECYCAARGLSPRHDATNDELHHTRNRVRHELLPLLEQYNPGIRRVLVRLADTAATDMEIIEHATQQAFASVLIETSAQGVTLDRAAWQQLPAGLQRATLREAVRQMKGDLTDLKYAGIEEARDVLNSSARSGQIAILADVRIHVTPTRFRLGDRE